MNSSNSLRLIDQVKADHQEQRHKLKNHILPQVYTPHAYVKTKVSQPCIAQTQACVNRYDALRVENTNEDDDTKETPLIERVEKAKTPTPIFNNEWEQIDNFI